MVASVFEEDPVLPDGSAEEATDGELDIVEMVSVAEERSATVGFMNKVVYPPCLCSRKA